MTAEELVSDLLTIDLTTGVNKKLKKMMINDNKYSDAEIEHQLYVMIKRMNTDKITKQVVEMKFVPDNGGIGDRRSGWGNNRLKELFSYGVNKNGTKKELMLELNAKLEVKRLSNYKI